jgi:hypothetical protein
MAFTLRLTASAADINREDRREQRFKRWNQRVQVTLAGRRCNDTKQLSTGTTPGCTMIILDITAQHNGERVP